MGNSRHTWLIALLCALTMLRCVGCTVFPDREKPARNGVTADEVAAAAALWADVMGFPDVVTAATSLPNDQYATGRETGISATVRDHATGEALQQRHSELAGHCSAALERS